MPEATHALALDGAGPICTRLMHDSSPMSPCPPQKLLAAVHHLHKSMDHDNAHLVHPIVRCRI
jgi:hypothetical protein